MALAMPSASAEVAAVGEADVVMKPSITLGAGFCASAPECPTNLLESLEDPGWAVLREGDALPVCLADID